MHFLKFTQGDKRMARKPNTTSSGLAFDQKTIDAVWAKAKLDPGYTSMKRMRAVQPFRKVNMARRWPSVGRQITLNRYLKVGPTP
jgi:hypothetical protein